MKKGTVNINVKKLMNYKQKLDEDDKPIPAEKVAVRVTVDDITVYNNSEVLEDTEKITQTIEGIGTVNVKVFIQEKGSTEVLKAQTNMNLNAGNAVWTVPEE